MKDKLLKFILDKDYAGVLTWGVDLSDKERYEAIDALMSIDLDDELKQIVNLIRINVITKKEKFMVFMRV